MTAVLEEDSWHFKAELSDKRSDCVPRVQKKDILHWKRKSQCGGKKQEENNTLPCKEHVILTGWFQILACV